MFQREANEQHCYKEKSYYSTNNKNAEISHKAQKEMAHEQENVYSFL